MAEAAHPKHILRGHKAQVHAATFIRQNSRLVTGDADGFVVLWDLAIARPRAVWRAHEQPILGLAGWGDDKIITHGRDHKLIVWKLAAADEESLSTALPLDDTAGARPQPWMLHLLEVNTLNFCSFAWCGARQGSPPEIPAELLIAVPNTLESEAVDIFHLPSQIRQRTIKANAKHGMVMALALLHRAAVGPLILICGYEDGVAVVSSISADAATPPQILYGCQAHSQPILSLDVSPQGYFITSGADAVIAKHPIPSPGGASVEATPLSKLDTRHAGQQGLRIRSDGKIFATAGWDSRIRVYSTRNLKEVAALKWHSTGCYAVSFSNILGPAVGPGASGSGGDSDATTAGVDRSTLQAETAAGGARFESVRSRRVLQARTAHWIAAGGKDGKVSLWDVF